MGEGDAAAWVVFFVFLFCLSVVMVLVFCCGGSYVRRWWGGMWLLGLCFLFLFLFICGGGFGVLLWWFWSETVVGWDMGR